MTLPPEQARLRAVVLKATGEAIRHADEAMVQAMHNRISNSDRRCHKAFVALVKARLALKQWGRAREKARLSVPQRKFPKEFPG